MADSLYKEMQELSEKRTRLDSYTIAQIIDGNPESEVFHINSITDMGTCNSFYKVKENEYFPLLKFLLSNGYIDETYNDSGIHPGSWFSWSGGSHRGRWDGYHLNRLCSI